ncbi:LD-carboxypeptidase [Pseudomonas sp. MWU16-30317]|uniref:S66 peptidase family protein n=1 Tax=Pseudomonas sp. MWU16-30317 TaxID=2878095 RepID=UPI001CFA1480|nr:LD-carboxypeptidase [Pseudomonas sp. MWU16-30317]
MNVNQQIAAQPREQGIAVPRLRPEGRIAIIAPAGPREFDVATAERWMAARGYSLKIFPGVLQQSGYLAGSDRVRLNDLHDAFADDQIDAIMCLRGGYGSPRLLDKIDYALLRRHAKPFVGYSDITALHLAIAKEAGFITFHGPMLTSEVLADRKPPTETSLRRLVRGQFKAGSELAHPATLPLVSIGHGISRGRLMGGNLAMISALEGTPWALEADGIILFIEDVNEPLYRIDRFLTQLRLSGKLAKIAGVLVGDFAGISVDEMTPLLRQMFEPLGIPVVAGWRSGHCDPNLTLPLGAMVRLDGGECRLWLEQDVVC